MKSFSFTIVMSLSIAFVMPVLADSRYQAIPLESGYEFGTEKAFVLDTVAGHMWIWVESPAVGDEKGGRYVIYQGQLSPGKDMGDIVLQQEWQPQKAE